MFKKQKLNAYAHSFNFGGIVLGMVFVYLGFLPSLLPRGWVLQGILGGVLFSIGYGLGALLSHIVRKYKRKEPNTKKKKQIKRNTYWALFAGYIVALCIGYNWQVQTRELVGQSSDGWFSVIGTAVLSLLFAALLIFISRIIRSFYGWLKRIINRHIPKAIAYTLAWVISFLVVVGILNGFIISNVMEGVNAAFSVKNDSTDAGITNPNLPQLSGSDQSVISWDSLGRQGRKFIGKVKTTQQLNSFSQATASNPVRIYSGLESSDNAKDRAKLAAADLKRAGGFDKKIVVVVTTTGTGWVDEHGVDPVEYMYNGDSAIVAMQYSYLPSWLSFLVDKSKAKEAGVELYNAVYDEWLALPQDKRPKIVVFGESLGSFGSEAAFPTKAAFQATTNGALWVGPPHSNESWQKVVENRDAGTPEILPVVNNGQEVRFANKPSDINAPGGSWSNPRAVYLQNPSDPIVWWTPKLLFSKPDWLIETRGKDVNTATRWIPIVTFLQVSGDMVFSTGVPDGHGHNYGNLPTDAWSYIAPPEGWNQQKTDMLKTELSK